MHDSSLALSKPGIEDLIAESVKDAVKNALVVPKHDIENLKQAMKTMSRRLERV